MREGGRGERWGEGGRRFSLPSLSLGDDAQAPARARARSQMLEEVACKTRGVFRAPNYAQLKLCMEAYEDVA